MNKSSAGTRPDPRGPMRTITKIVEGADGTAITCDCGHTSGFAQHFTYKLGALIRCFRCSPSSDSDKGESK